MINKMVLQIGKRLLQSLIIIIFVTMIVFFLIQAVPGDPILNFLGATATEEQIAHYTQLYGYDKPVIFQYALWLGGIFRGDMGFSVSYQTNVQNVIFTRLGTTLSIVVPALILAVVLGILFGIIAALNRGKPIDTVISVVANIGMSMPLFWIGILLILVFGIRLRWLPTNGYVPISEGFLTWLRYLIMPVIVCSFGALATLTRQTRSALLEVIRQDYVTTARSKGVRTSRVIFAHQLRNALIPIVTVLGGQFAMLVGGTVLIESVFVLPGLGNLMIGAIHARDHMLLCGCVVIIAAFVAVIQLIVDILYSIIDPRIRGS